MKGKYHESEYEKVVVELLQQTGWDYTHGSELHNRKLTEPLAVNRSNLQSRCPTLRRAAALCFI